MKLNTHENYPIVLNSFGMVMDPNHRKPAFVNTTSLMIPRTQHDLDCPCDHIEWNGFVARSTILTLLQNYKIVFGCLSKVWICVNRWEYVWVCQNTDGDPPWPTMTRRNPPTTERYGSLEIKRLQLERPTLAITSQQQLPSILHRKLSRSTLPIPTPSKLSTTLFSSG